MPYLVASCWFWLALAATLGAGCTNLSTKNLGASAASSFTGLSTAVIDDGKIVLTWSPATLGADSAPPTYRVYSGTTFDQAIYQGTETTYTIPLTGKAAGSEWTYGVRVLSTSGVPDGNTTTKTVKIPADATAIVGLTFAGLTKAGVTLAADYSVLHLTWSPATNANGDVHYEIYDDAAFSDILGTATTTSFDLVQPTPGKVYVLGVRAFDASSGDKNTATVVFSVPLQLYGGCDSAAATVSGTNTISFSIPAWANQVVIKRDGATLHTAVLASESPWLDTTAPTQSPSHYLCSALGLQGQEVSGAKLLTVAPLSVPAPTVTRIQPSAGTTAGGTSVVITGTNFSSSSLVHLASATCTSITVVSPTSLTCVTPARAAVTGDVTVLNADGQQGSLTNGFTFTSTPAPTVAGVAPPNAPLAGGVDVLISGSHFNPQTTATIAGRPCTGVTVASSSALTCTVPAGVASGPVSVVVTNSDGQAGTAPAAFIYNGPVTIAALTPLAGSLSGGTRVQVTGSGFVVGGISVTIGGVNCDTVQVNSWTSLSCSTGAHAAGVADVVVSGSNATSATLVHGYTYQDGPLVQFVLPDFQSDLNGGRPVTIRGSGFGPLAQASIGGVPCQATTVQSTTSLTCYVPSMGTASSGADVVVANPDGQTSTLSKGYRYNGAWSRIDTLTGPSAPYGVANGSGTAVRIANVGGMVSDGTLLYFTDPGNQTIRTYNETTGVVSTWLTSAGQGCVDGIGGTLYYPSKLAINSAKDTLYVVDDAAIRKISLATKAITTIAGSCSSYGAPAVDGTGLAAVFNGPTGIVIDSANTNLYVSEGNAYAVRKIVIATGVVTTLAGSLNVTGAVTGSGATSRFNYIGDIAYDGTSLYTVEPDLSVVRKITTAGVTSIWAGAAGSASSVDGTGTAARLNRPSVLSYSGGSLYVLQVCCGIGQPVRKIVTATAAVTTVISSGQGGSPVDGYIATNGHLAEPNVMAIEGTKIYVYESYQWHLLRLIDLTPGVQTISTVAGDIGLNSHVDGSAAAARFVGPLDSTVSDGTSLFIHSDDYTIRQVSLATGAVTTIAGTPHVYGNAPGVGSAAQLSGNHGITYANGILYFFNDDALMQLEISTATVSTLISANGGFADGVDGVAQLSGPHSPSYLNGSIYFPDNSQTIRQYNLSTKMVTSVAGSPGITGLLDAAGPTARFDSLGASATDGVSLYVIDQGCQIIRKITPGSRAVTTVAGGYGNINDGIGTGAGFNCIQWLTSDGLNIYAGEQNYAWIRKFNTVTGAVTTPLNSSGADIDGSLAINGQVSTPRGLAYANGRLYIGTFYGVRFIH